MAYKEETDQQFMESIMGQVGMPNRYQQPQQPLQHTNFMSDDNGGEEDEAILARQDIKEIKKLIKQKEEELHELQRKKVELMRKVTGRL